VDREWLEKSTWQNKKTGDKVSTVSPVLYSAPLGREKEDGFSTQPVGLGYVILAFQAVTISLPSLLG
jgi:hypothetical protein